MENNGSLLKHKVAGEMTEEDDDSRLDASNMHGAPKYAHGNAGKTGATRRVQP